MKEKCAKCGEVGQDRRTLFMSCFYDMSELDVPFEQHTFKLDDASNRAFFTLRVCKACRATWLRAIQAWYKEAPKEPTGSGIYVRKFGAAEEQ